MHGRSSSLEASRDTQPAAPVSTPPPSPPPHGATDAAVDDHAAAAVAAAAPDAPEPDYLRYDANAILDALLRMTSTTTATAPFTATAASDARTSAAAVAAAPSQLPTAATPSPSVMGRSLSPSDGPHYLDATTEADSAAAVVTEEAAAAASTTPTSCGASHTPNTHPLATPVTGTPAAAQARSHRDPRREAQASGDVEREVSVERLSRGRHSSIRVVGRVPSGSTGSHALDAATLPTGLVSSTHATPSTTAAWNVSPHADTRQRPLQPAPASSSAQAAGLGGRGGTSAGQPAASPRLGTSTALSLNAVGGPQWQHAFAATAQRLLSETQQQVQDLRRYRSAALREAQRADVLAAAQQSAEAQLAELTTQRGEERAAHQRAVQEVSRQVLCLEEAVGLLRRTKVDLQRQLQQAQTDAAEAQRMHAADVHQLREDLARLGRDARAAHQRMKEERGAWAAREAALQLELTTHRAHNERLLHESNSGDAAAAASAPSSAALVVQPERANAAVNTTTANSNSVRSSAAASTESASSSYERVHRDVLAQQHLREQTILSELEKVEARRQQECGQRRAAEMQVAALLEQNAQLQESLAAAVRSRDDTPERADVSCHARDAAAELVDAAALMQHHHESLKEYRVAEQQRHQQQYEATLAELQREYAQLLEASDELAERLARRTRESAEEWTALRSGVVSAIRAVDMHEDDLDAVHAELAADASAAGGADVVRAVCRLVQVLCAQRDAAAVAAQAALEQRRLSNLEDALQAAEAQNQERRTLLEATEAELHEARRALAVWQQRQQALTARQDLQAAALRTAQAQLQQVASVARRAMREYGKPLSAVQLRTGAAGAPLSHDVEGDGGHSRGASVRFSPSLVSSTAHEAAAVSEKLTAASTSTVRGAHSVGLDGEGDPLQLMGGEEDEEEGASSSTTGTAALPRPARADGDGEPGVPSDITADVTVVSKALFKLLTAWRHRQHHLVESHAALERQLADLEEQQRSTTERQQAVEAHVQQQLRLSRAAEHRHEQKAEELQRALDAATDQHAAEEVRARQRVTALETELEALQRRLQSSNRELHTAEQALVEAAVGRSEHGAALAALQDALGNAVDERDRLTRHEMDLRVHTEDLEAQLEGASENQDALHAMLTSCLTSLVRLLADHQQLRAHYEVLGALAARDGMCLAVVEGVLRATLPGDGGATPPLLLLRPPPPPRQLLANAHHLRSVVIAVCAVRRLARFVTHRHGVLQRGDATAAPPPSSAADDVARPSVLLALSAPETAAAVTHEVSQEAAMLAGSAARLLRRYTTPSRPGAAPVRGVWPVVRLPPPSALAKAYLNAHRATRPESDTAADGHAQSLRHLLTAAQLDTQAPATRHVWAEMLSAVSASAALQAQVQQERRVHRAWAHALGKCATQPRPDLPDFADVLPRRLAAALQRHLATSALQLRHLTEAKAMVQRLVHQNGTLVSALEKRSHEHACAIAELDGARAQLRERLASQEDVTVVQARLVDTHAALLQERKQRRAAEDKLAKLHDERVTWLGAQETYKREVYALHMELAEVEAAAASRRPRGASHASDARDTTRASALTIETEAPSAVTEAAAQLHRGGHFPVTHSPVRGANAAAAAAAACLSSERESRRSAENTYYDSLLRRARPGDAEGGAHRASADGSAGGAARTTTAPLEYVPRFNLPAPHELCHRAGDLRVATTSQRALQPAHRAHATSALATRATRPLELFVPNIVRCQEKASPEAPVAPAPAPSASDGVAFAASASLHAGVADVVDSAATPPPLARHPPRRPTVQPLASPPAPQVQLHRDEAARTLVPHVRGVAVPLRTHAASPPQLSSSQPQPSPALSESTASFRSVTHDPAPVEPTSAAAEVRAAPSRSISQRLSYSVSADTHTEAPASSREPSTSVPVRNSYTMQPVSGPLYFTARATR